MSWSMRNRSKYCIWFSTLVKHGTIYIAPFSWAKGGGRSSVAEFYGPASTSFKEMFQASFLKRTIKPTSVATHLFMGIILNIRKSLRWQHQVANITVGSVTLACRSHSITSPPRVIFTQTHSWAQSCPVHWQCCYATSKCSQHMG